MKDTVATYGSWSLSGTVLPNSGTWLEYDSPILNVYAVWFPKNFTVELNDEYTGKIGSELA